MQERILLVAQSPVLRVGIRGVLDGAASGQVILDAENGLQATALAEAHTPTFAIIQDALRGISGVVVARAIREVSPRTQIVVLTEDGSAQRFVSAIVHGVDALLPAEIDGNGLLAALARLRAGDRPLDTLVMSRPDIATKVFNAARSVAAGAPSMRSSTLTGRELAILDGVVRGLSNREIATGLYVVEQTVKNHMTTLLRKLSAGDRTEAVVSAVRIGMIDLGAQLPVAPVETGAMSSAA